MVMLVQTPLRRRKSRSPNPGSDCLGTDLNRNFDDGKWGGPGSSSDPCSSTYHGSGSLSNPETLAVSDYLQALQRDGQIIIGGIDFHSYGQLILRSVKYL
jgi:hypothetical protein